MRRLGGKCATVAANARKSCGRSYKTGTPKYNNCFKTKNVEGGCHRRLGGKCATVAANARKSCNRSYKLGSSKNSECFKRKNIEGGCMRRLAGKCATVAANARKSCGRSYKTGTPKYNNCFKQKNVDGGCHRRLAGKCAGVAAKARASCGRSYKTGTAKYNDCFKTKNVEGGCHRRLGGCGQAWTKNGAILQIRNMKSHRNVGSYKINQNLQMWDKRNAWNQKWRVVNVRGKYFMLKTLKGNKYLGNRGFWAGLQVQAAILHYNNKTGQLMKGNKCLNIYGGKNKNAQPIRWTPCARKWWQKFSLHWVGGTRVTRCNAKPQPKRPWTTLNAILQIRSMKNNMNLEFSFKRKYEVKLRPIHNRMSQEWRIENVKGKYFMLQGANRRAWGRTYLDEKRVNYKDIAGISRRPTWLHYNNKTHQIMRGNKCLSLYMLRTGLTQGLTINWLRCKHNSKAQKFRFYWVAGAKVARNV